MITGLGFRYAFRDRVESGQWGVVGTVENQNNGDDASVKTPPSANPLLLAALCAGCSPDAPVSFGPGSDYVEDTGWDGSHDPVSWLRDHWTSTYATCQPPEPFESYAPILSDPCSDALAGDLNIDLEDFATETSQDGLLRLLTDAWYLSARDQGSIDDLRSLDEDDGYYVREPFIEQIELVAAELGHSEVRHAVYDLVMSTILLTQKSTDPNAVASFNLETRTLSWRTGGSGTAGGALTLVHEAAHGWQYVRHVPCPEGFEVEGVDYSGQSACDDDWAGAWGFMAASAHLMYLGALREQPGHASDIQRSRAWAAQFILEE